MYTIKREYKKIIDKISITNVHTWCSLKILSICKKNENIMLSACYC